MNVVASKVDIRYVVGNLSRHSAHKTEKTGGHFVNWQPYFVTCLGGYVGR
jgi:hypothetical protein